MCQTPRIFFLAGCLALMLVAPARTDSPDAKPPVLTDFFGDPLPPGAVARLGTLRFRHRGEINSLAYSPDGKVLAASGRDGQIRFWDPNTGKELANLKDHTSTVCSLAFTSDGKTLASGSADETIRIWDLSQWSEKATISPILTIADHKKSIGSVAFSPDGKMLASASAWDPAIKLWDLSNWRAGGAKPPVSSIDGHGNGVLAVAFSPDGKMLASGGYNQAKLWDVSSRQLKASFPHKLECMSVAFRPDGKMLASASMDGAIKLWDLSQKIVPDGNTSYLIINAHSHGAGDISLAFSRDGKILASGSADSTVKLWDLDKLKPGAATTPVHTLSGPFAFLNVINSVAISPDGKTVAAGGLDQVVKLWDIKTGKPKLIPEPISQTRNDRTQELERGHSCMVDALAFSPAGLTIATAGSTEFNIKVWRLSEPTKNSGALALDQCLTRKTGRVFYQTFSSDGKLLASTGWGGYIQIWDMPAVTERIGLEAPKVRAFRSLAFSPDSRTLASTCDRDEAAGVVSPLLLWNLKTGKEITDFKGPRWASRVAFNSDGTTMAIGGAKGAVKLWDVAKGKEWASLTHGDDWTHCTSFSPDGKILGTDQKEIFLWDVLATKPIGKLLAYHGNRSFEVAFSPDGKMLASEGEDGVVKLWDLTKCRSGMFSNSPEKIAQAPMVRNLVGHFGFITGVAFSPDSRFLASSSKDTTVLLWDIASLRKAQEKESPPLQPDAIASYWNDLAGDNAAKAYEAIWTLASVPSQAVPFIRDHLRPVPTPDLKRLEILIADLDSKDFSTRDHALKELEKSQDLTGPFIRDQMKGQPHLEVRRRLEQLLEKIEGPVSDPEQLRGLRAIEVLEHIGTPGARDVLQTLAKGAPEARLTQEAKASLGRLDKRTPKPAATN
jgi:WD40 repeat protein